MEKTFKFRIIMNNYKLSASLICANIANLEKDLKVLKKNKIDQIHIDVMDGSFVPRFGLCPEILEIVKKIISIPVDIHLMIDKPERYIETFYNAGVNRKEDYIIFHFESTNAPDRILRLIKEKGVKAGVALNISTPLNVLDYILDNLDLVLLMGINPGILGHKLIPSVIKKITHLRKKIKNSNIKIEVDGGVSFGSSRKLIDAGADILVCGSQTIFNKDSLGKNIIKLRKELNIF